MTVQIMKRKSTHRTAFTRKKSRNGSQGTLIDVGALYARAREDLMENDFDNWECLSEDNWAALHEMIQMYVMGTPFPSSKSTNPVLALFMLGAVPPCAMKVFKQLRWRGCQSLARWVTTNWKCDRQIPDQECLERTFRFIIAMAPRLIHLAATFKPDHKLYETAQTLRESLRPWSDGRFNSMPTGCIVLGYEQHPFREVMGYERPEPHPEKRFPKQLKTVIKHVEALYNIYGRFFIYGMSARIVDRRKYEHLIKAWQEAIIT